jgi:dTMP kinase
MQKNPSKKRILITFEGIEGVGKSTQTQLLWETLDNLGYECRLTREPGGTDFGDSLRPCLLGEYAHPLDSKTELCLLLAARRHHLETVVIPALEAGTIVIIDRFIDASIAYQGYGRGLSIPLIMELHRLLDINLVPTLTFLLRAPINISRQRIHRRGFVDRIEREDDNFFERVSQGYAALAAEQPERIATLNACDSREHIAEQILNKVLATINA